MTLAATTASGCVTSDLEMAGRGPMAANRPQMAAMPPGAVVNGAVGPWGEPVAAMPTAMPQQGMGIPQEMLTPVGMIPPMPGGVMQAQYAPGFGGMPCTPGGGGAGGNGGGGGAPSAQRTQVRFAGPAGAVISWQVGGGEGAPAVMTPQLNVPGRYNFIQASIYRIKVSNIAGRPGLDLYPTIEVVPSNARTEAFLAHNYVPVEFTDEDFDQVSAGNFITKVVYLPDAQFQGDAGAAEVLSSTRLDPGVDPVAEAHRRGHILLIVRVGGIDLEAKNTPPLGGSSMFTPPGAAPAGMGGMPPLPPPGMMPPAGPVQPTSYQMPGGPGMTPPGAPTYFRTPQHPGAAFPQTGIPGGPDVDLSAPYSSPRGTPRRGLLGEWLNR